MTTYYSSLRAGAIALSVALLTAFSRQAAAQISNVLIPAGKAKMVPVDKFTPDVTVADSAFECGTPEAHPADLLLPVDAISYSAAVPSRATERMSIVVFVDSTGSILRFAERRGDPIRPDTKGLPPSQVALVGWQSAPAWVSMTFRLWLGSALAGSMPQVGPGLPPDATALSAVTFRLRQSNDWLSPPGTLLKM